VPVFSWLNISTPKGKQEMTQMKISQYYFASTCPKYEALPFEGKNTTT
jgi:hypothetical protein